MDLEKIIFTIIAHSGNAKSKCFEALNAAKQKNFSKAEELIKEAKEELLKAHHIQTEILQKEAQGQRQELNLLLIHAEDHLMNTMLAKDLIEELIEFYKIFTSNKFIERRILND
ncbi:MAG: PTS lactose/cellobiose transporter subunit IIA [Thermovenabulum sp.]|uniref:PTS lactose/cellobiose transporter subunit IIA n=1 Tax=Thermovenabulum sp. TaxID=3100335 RepID=UPI003C7A15EE